MSEGVPAWVRRILLVALVLSCGGCAHAILIAPDGDRLPDVAAVPHTDKAVGYYISSVDRARTITTPGGGGDSVAYAPYKELEPALYRVLSRHFDRVYSLSSNEDFAFVREKNIRFVFAPRFETQSSSDSLLTWPPTDFGVTIDVTAIDGAAKPVWHARVTGSGQATFSEFKSDFGLAAKRAAEAAFRHLDEELEKFAGM